MDRLTDKDPGAIAGMFDAIAPRYDALNHILSAGIDRRWRRRAIAALELRGGEAVLDLCTGTADLAMAALHASSKPRVVVGVDFAIRMLQLGQRKIERAGLASRLRLIQADATRLPIEAGTMDAATIGFGIRNVQDAHAACVELVRVLKPGGRLAILEFGRPFVPILGGAYLWYFGHVLPRIGRIVSGHDSAYSYLLESVKAFPSPDRFGRLLAGAGFVNVRYVPLTLGVVYLYIAQRR